MGSSGCTKFDICDHPKISFSTEPWEILENCSLIIFALASALKHYCRYKEHFDSINNFVEAYKAIVKNIYSVTNFHLFRHYPIKLRLLHIDVKTKTPMRFGLTVNIRQLSVYPPAVLLNLLKLTINNTWKALYTQGAPETVKINFNALILNIHNLRSNLPYDRKDYKELWVSKLHIETEKIILD